MKFVVLLMCCLLASASAFKIDVQIPDASALECSICEYIVSEIVDQIEANTSVSDIIADLNEDCAQLYNPSWIATCRSIVSDDGAQLVPYLESNDATGACSHFDFCAAAPAPQKEEPIKGEIECGVCTFVAAKVEEYVAENKTESEIVTELNKDCRVFRAKSWISVCDGLVDEFTPEMIQLAESKYPADVICQDVKFCNASSAVAKPVLAVGGEIECEVCDWLVTLGEHYATLNYTEDEIVHTMADSCDILVDSSFVAACKELVDSEGDAIVEYILSKEDPSTICSQIGVCDNSTCADATTIDIAPAPVAAQVGDVECSVCEWLASIGEKFVSENKTEAEILDGLAKSCDLLIDKTWISDCHSLVESDGDVIVQYLLEKETPEVICSQIGACSSSSRKVAVVAQLGDVECSVCTWLTTLGERYVEENKTETEIVYALAKSCDILIDQNWVNECHALIIQEGDVIVQYLLNKEDPQVICQQIGACTNSSSAPVAVSNEKSVECSVCTWLATLGEHYVEQNKTESEILDSLSIACDVLIDEKWITECHNLVEEDGDVLVEYLLNKETPEVVCEQIEACPNNSTAIPPRNSPLPVRTPLLNLLL